MPNNPISRDEMLEILETAASTQLKTLRALRRKSQSPPPTASKKGKSNMDIVKDILQSAHGPLHINDLLAKALKQHGVKLSRESLVSALTKKVLDQNTFARTAPNTFALLNRSAQS
jgi:hypothetical protein